MQERKIQPEEYVFVQFDCDGGQILYKDGVPIMCREEFRNEDWIKALEIEWKHSECKYDYFVCDKTLSEVEEEENHGDWNY